MSKRATTLAPCSPSARAHRADGCAARVDPALEVHDEHGAVDVGPLEQLEQRTVLEVGHRAAARGLSHTRRGSGPRRRSDTAK